MSDPRDSERGRVEGAGVPAGEPAGAPAPEALADLVIVGRVRKAHGVRGELVVESMTTAPEVAFGTGRRLVAGNPEGRPLRSGRTGPPRELTVRRASPFKGGWILALSSIDDRNEADLWRDRTLLAPAAELPPAGDDEVHYHDLVGLRVQLADGTPVGEVVELYELPQGLVIEVRRDTPATGTALVPYRPDMVAEV